MAAHRFSASAVIEAPPRDVYAIIADYRDGHPRIVPRPPFVALDVEVGGTGEGTVIRVQMRVLGQLQTFRATVTEPEPGRVLEETSDTGYVTRFIVDPRAGGRHSLVAIETQTSGRGGAMGVFERWVVPRLLRPVYARELELLATVAGERAAAAVGR